jgi:hypothetical protein
MTNTICFDKTGFLFTLTFLISYIFVYLMKSTKQEHSLNILNITPVHEQKPVQEPVQEEPVHQNTNNIKTVIVEQPDRMEIRDPIREYDYRQVYDPLERPSKREHRWNLPRLHSIPTRGYPDNFRTFGILTNTNTDATEYKLLRLFGRERFRSSNQYEYYTMISSGNETIKIPITTKRKYVELYDDDEITIDEINSTFNVKIHRNHDYDY